MVVNRTRVRAAGLLGTKARLGGRGRGALAASGDRRHLAGRWCVQPADCGPETVLELGQITATIEAGPEDGVAMLSLESDGDLEEAIARTGPVPLPPYITEPLRDSERYQTIFARPVGSAAAPTAGLHFTDRVVEGLAQRDIAVVEIELKIGLDTFRPISVEAIEDHLIHTEELEVPAGDPSRDQVLPGPVVAVGTTVVRALESDPSMPATSLYITPGFVFHHVDLMVTNFHLPRTSLLVMLAAFMGERWRLAYETALARGYRFASFGDAMLASRRMIPGSWTLIGSDRGAPNWPPHTPLTAMSPPRRSCRWERERRYAGSMSTTWQWFMPRWSWPTPTT